jgi:nucleotide-binding universal stress UspA family protein
MYHVIVGVDDNRGRALACAEAVADLPGDPADRRVTVVHSFTDGSADGAADVPAVRTLIDRLEAAGVAVDVTEATGDPAERVREAAAEVDADLVVLAGRKRSPAGKALFGSVTQSVILNADRPVMVVGEAAE